MATRRCWGTSSCPNLILRRRDLRWFTLRIDLESLSPQRSREFVTAKAMAAAATSSSSSSAQVTPSAASPKPKWGEAKRTTLKHYIKQEDPTRHAYNQAGEELLSKRAKRQHRQHSTNYKFRLFTEDEEKAAFAASPRACPPFAAAALQCAWVRAVCSEPCARFSGLWW